MTCTQKLAKAEQDLAEARAARDEAYRVLAERYAMDAEIEGMIERLAWYEANYEEQKHAA